MKGMNKKSRDPQLDHYVINPVGRDFAAIFIDDDTLRQLDQAKCQIAETAGVRVEHIRLEIQMLILAEI